MTEQTIEMERTSDQALDHLLGGPSEEPGEGRPEPGSKRHRELAIDLLSQMVAQGRLSSAHLPQGEIRPKGKVREDWYQSNWYALADFCNIPFPAIVTMMRPEDEMESVEQTQTLSTLRRELGLVPYQAVTSGRSFSLCLGGELPGDGLPFAPRDITLPQEQQEASRSGLVFNPGSAAGKVNKRLKPAIGFAERAAFIPRPCDPSQEIILPEDPAEPGTARSLKVLVVETPNAIGDGQGIIATDAAIAMFRATEGQENGISRLRRAVGDTVALQVKILARATDFKAILLVRQRGALPPEWQDYDVIVDSECIKRDVTTEHFTAMTVNLLGDLEKPPQHTAKVGGLMQIHALLDVTYVDELTSVMRDIARESGTRDLEVLGKRQDAARRPPEPGKDYGDLSDTAEWLVEWLTGKPIREERDSNEDLWLRFQARNPDDEGLAWLSLLASGHNPAANPLAAQVTTGRTAKQMEAALTPRNRRRAGLPHMMVQGARVFFMYHGFAGVSRPKPGYVRPVWTRDSRNRRRFVGICENEENAKQVSVRLDTADKDGDEGVVVLLKDDSRHYYALLLRSPMSVGGGHLAKLTRENGRDMEREGMHAYRIRSEEIRFNGLYEVGEDGEMVNPSVVRAGELPEWELPKWSTEPHEIYNTMYRLTRFNRNIGVGCNISFALHASDLWEPSQHWSNMSEELIDHCHNGTANTDMVRDTYLESMLEMALNGESFERRFFETKCRAMLLRHYKDTEEAMGRPRPKEFPVEIRTHLKPEYEAIAASSRSVVQTAARALDIRRRMANGPIEGLVENSRTPEAAHHAMQAYAARIEAWSNQNGISKIIQELENSGEIGSWQANRLRAESISEAAEASRTAAEEAYREYREMMPDEEPGDMARALRRLHLLDRNRWNLQYIRQDGSQRVANLTQIGALPAEEIYGAHLGETAYTVLTRLVGREGKPNRYQPTEGAEYLMAYGQTTGKPCLFSEGKKVADLSPEAEDCLWPGEPVAWQLRVRYRGTVKTESGTMDLRQTEDTIHVFELLHLPQTPDAPSVTCEEHWQSLAGQGVMDTQGNIL